ncbi:MAG: Gfo/Idh/MocA family protein [Sedimentisphaerales bacterium]
MNNYRLGLIGCGLRGVWYLYNLRQSRLNVSLVAVADIDQKYCGIANKLFAKNEAVCFKNGEDLINNADLDGVIIASPNDVHCGPMVLAAKKHLKILLEKPIATSVEDFAAMWQAHEQNDGQIVVGFVLRYAPFYSKIKEVVRSGEIGKILAITAEELMSDELSMAFNRGDWRPNSERSGGLLLEKCCHDMDIINWLADSKASSVFSNAERTFLEPKHDAGLVCSKCKIEKTCRFSNAHVIKPFETEWPSELHEMFGKFSDETCAYRNHKYPDHQAVTIKYENGVLCNFIVAQAQPATRRTIHILGSKGRIYGVLNDECFTLFRRTGADNEVRHIIEVHPDKSGHGGGDSILTNDFFKLLQGNPNLDRPGLKEGVESALMCIAADKSVQTGQQILLADMQQQIFAQPPSVTQAQKPVAI